MQRAQRKHGQRFPSSVSRQDQRPWGTDRKGGHTLQAGNCARSLQSNSGLEDVSSCLHLALSKLCETAGTSEGSPELNTFETRSFFKASRQITQR